jgi:hypothetical protein
MNRICLLLPVIVFIVIKLFIICIRLIIRPIISVLIINCTTIRIMPVIDSTRLLSSIPRTANRIILLIMYEIVLIKCNLLLYEFDITQFPFLSRAFASRYLKKIISTIRPQVNNFFSVFIKYFILTHRNSLFSMVCSFIHSFCLLCIDIYLSYTIYGGYKLLLKQYAQTSQYVHVKYSFSFA